MIHKYQIAFFLLILLVFLYPNPYTLTPVLADNTCVPTTDANNPRAEGLVQTPQLGNQFKISSSGKCLIDTKAAFAPYTIPTYASLKSLYFDQSKTSQKQPIPDLQREFIGDGVYLVNGNLTVGEQYPKSGTQVIFVNGNLTIHADIKGNLTCGGNSGLIFVVSGDVYIPQNIIQIDAVIISSGTIYTAAADSGHTCNTSTVLVNNKLIINGSLISLDESKPIKFCRNLGDNSQQPAELINHQVKYLVLLRNLMSDDAKKWSEIDASTPLPASGTIFNPAPGGQQSSGLSCTGCHPDIFTSNGQDCTKSLLCANNFSDFTRSSICGPNNINACNTNGASNVDTTVSPNRLKYSSGNDCSMGGGTCGFPYSPSGNHDAVCGATTTTTIDGETGNWDTVSACNADGTRKTYHTGTACTQTGTCNYPVPINCTTLDASSCHGDISGYNGSSVNNGCDATRKTCPSNISTYVPSQGQATVCGSSGSTIDNHTACNGDNTLKTYYNGTFTGTSCNKAPCSFPYAPSGNQSAACQTACANSTTPNKYYPGTSCTQVNCPFPPAVTCPTNTCHGIITGYDGTDCSNAHTICASNASSYGDPAATGQKATCGANTSGTVDNHTACNGTTLKTYYTGTVTSTACNQGTCGYPYSPSGNHQAVCGATTTTTIDGASGSWDTPSACANITTRNTYYTGSACTQTGTCNWPIPINCAALDAASCHGDVSGYNGSSVNNGCDPTRKTCPANYTTFTGYSTSNQSYVCGSSNSSACNADGTLKRYSDGGSCGTSGTCGYPYSPAPGQQTSICGSRTGSNDSNGCTSPGGSIRIYYPGNSCSQTNCLPNPAVTCPASSCHGDIYGYNGTGCGNSLICASNAASYANQSSVCGGVDNTTACSGSSLTTYYTGSFTGTSCNTATCGYPYSPSGNHNSICASDNSNACADQTTLKTYYPGNSCSQTSCGYPPALNCTTLDANSCHGDTTGYNGLSCNTTSKTCLNNISSYYPQESCPTTCHAGTVFVRNGDSCDPNIKNKSCAGNPPAAGTCPSTCHIDTQTVPDGACGATSCPPNPPAANSLPPACRTSSYDYYNGSICGVTTTYAANCTTFCDSGSTGNRCYVSSQVVYDSFIPTRMWWRDRWRNSDSTITIIDTSAWIVQNLALNRNGCITLNCGGMDNAHEWVSISGLQQSARDNWGWGLPSGFARTYVPNIYNEGAECHFDKDNCSDTNSGYTLHENGNIYVK